MAKEILVVDDEPNMIDITQAVLEEKGFRVTGVHSGKECLDRLRKKKPDLILLDIRMPGMDGWDVLKEIKRDERTKAVPVMMYTVVEKSLDDETLRERGVEEYIVKPFRIEDLVRKVEKIMKKR
jgi:CheY-like chemotaxis protein